MTKAKLLREIRIWLAIVILGLFVSGVTAFPLEHETAWAASAVAHLHIPALAAWITQVHGALADTYARYPYIAYGTDWLAFAHLVIAVAFIGPWQDPVRNRWIITWGLIACAAVPLLAFGAGPVRGIPVYWRLIDSSFGLGCCIPLLFIRRKINRLEALS